jgi:hypothetical protein
MIAKLLGYPSGTAALAEGLDHPGHGLPDFLVTGMVTALQGRHEQGIGPDDTNTDVVRRWPHDPPPLLVPLYLAEHPGRPVIPAS